MKGLKWYSHEVDLGKGQNFIPWYLGINPRGLVPTLILNGAIYIESNDIIQVLDEKLQDNILVPAEFKNVISELSRHEIDLHRDLYALTFRFIQPRGKTPKTARDLWNYHKGVYEIVHGRIGMDKEREIDFWQKP
jgi:glutathione S-transferase